MSATAIAEYARPHRVEPTDAIPSVMTFRAGDASLALPVAQYKRPNATYVVIPDQYRQLIGAFFSATAGCSGPWHITIMPLALLLPPKTAEYLLRFAIAPTLRPDPISELAVQYERHVGSYGVGRARRWYVWWAVCYTFRALGITALKVLGGIGAVKACGKWLN